MDVDEEVVDVAVLVLFADPDEAAAGVEAGPDEVTVDFLADLDERGAWGALSDLGPPRT